MIASVSTEGMFFVIVIGSVLAVSMVGGSSWAVLSLLRMLRFGRRRQRSECGTLQIPLLLFAGFLILTSLWFASCRWAATNPESYEVHVISIIAGVSLLVGVTALLRVLFVIDYER